MKFLLLLYRLLWLGEQRGLSAALGPGSGSLGDLGELLALHTSSGHPWALWSCVGRFLVPKRVQAKPQPLSPGLHCHLHPAVPMAAAPVLCLLGLVFVIFPPRPLRTQCQLLPKEVPPSPRPQPNSGCDCSQGQTPTPQMRAPQTPAAPGPGPRPPAESPGQDGLPSPETREKA